MLVSRRQGRRDSSRLRPIVGCHLIWGIDNGSEARDSGPGVDEVDTGRLEVANVASGEHRSSGCGDAGDLNVSDLYRPAVSLLVRGNSSRGESRSLIESLNAAVKIVGKQSGEVLVKLFTTPTVLRRFMPVRISKTVIEVVQIDSAGSLSSQSTTAESGAFRISAESTLVSSKIMSRTAQGAQDCRVTRGYRR